MLTYYLPGRGGRLNGGLGTALGQFGEVRGRELSGDFARLRFDEQVELIRADLHGQDCPVVANSFGCYLLLNALLDQPPYPGRILLLSPILGDAENPDTGMVYCPPRARTFFDALLAGKLKFAAPAHVLVGSEDWQCNRAALPLLRASGALVEELSGGGHELGKEAVGGALRGLSVGRIG